MAVSKVVYGGNTLIDLTQDTVKSNNLLKGFKAHGADGELVEGQCTFDVDSSETNVNEDEVLEGKTYAKGGEVHTGRMKNNAGAKGSIASKDEEYGIAQGYHDGSGKVGLAETEKEKLIPANIREGVTLFGVLGEMSGSEDAKPQARTVTPKTTEQVVLPEEGYNYLSQVTVEAIPYNESENVAGGITVTIGNNG
jgi:hypothetical protein